MIKKLYPLFSQVFRILFTGRCYCCAFAFVGLLVLHGTGVADKAIGGGPQPDLKAVELLMSADDNFKKDNSPSNRMALIEVLLTFEEESLRIQAANHAKQLIRELPDDPEACNLYCKSALSIQDDVMIQKCIRKLKQTTSPEDFDRRWDEIANNDQRSTGAFPGSGAAGKVIFASGFLRYAAHGFAAWASMLAVLMLAGQAVAKGSPQPDHALQPLHKNGSSNMRNDRRHWHKMLLKLRRFSIYCSIPFIFVLAVVILMGLMQMFIVTGSIPLRQIVVFGMMVLVSLVISICCMKEINK